MRPISTSKLYQDWELVRYRLANATQAYDRATQDLARLKRRHQALKLQFEDLSAQLAGKAPRPKKPWALTYPGVEAKLSEYFIEYFTADPEVSQADFMPACLAAQVKEKPWFVGIALKSLHTAGKVARVASHGLRKVRVFRKDFICTQESAPESK
jgi:hypothetical protein